MAPPRMLFIAWLLVAVASLSAASPKVGKPIPTVADQSLVRYMMRSTLNKDPGTSVKCFEYFIPILNLINEEFSKDYQQCSAIEEAQIDALNENAKSDRNQIELDAHGVCVQLDACNDYAMPLDFFDCFARQAKASSGILYTVTQNSTSIGAELREQYHKAEVERIKCQNATERAYVERTAITYQALDDCLQTGAVPTVPPETTTTTVEITTDNPFLTTEEEAEEITRTLPPQADMMPSLRDLNRMSRLRKLWPN